MYPILDKIKNKAFENLNLNVCFDFFFEKHGDFKDQEEIHQKKTVRVVKNSTKVETFHSHEHKPYQAVSDHFGLSTEIEIAGTKY